MISLCAKHSREIASLNKISEAEIFERKFHSRNAGIKVSKDFKLFQSLLIHLHGTFDRYTMLHERSFVSQLYFCKKLILYFLNCFIYVKSSKTMNQFALVRPLKIFLFLACLSSQSKTMPGLKHPKNMIFLHFLPPLNHSATMSLFISLLLKLRSLTQFTSMFNFYTLWKYQKTKDFFKSFRGV